MNDSRILGYQSRNGFIRALNATTKMVFLVLVSIACMVTYDARFLVAIRILFLVLLKIADIRQKQVSFIVRFIVVLTIINILTVSIFQPTYGESLHHSRTVLIDAGYFTLTVQELFYLFNASLKYICSISLVPFLLLTTSPSQFAASLNGIGVSYKISYAVSLALCHIPNIRESYWSISAARQVRGNKLSKKASLSKRTHGALNIVTPLIFSSLGRIDTVSTAMQLRYFGLKKERTWYVTEKFSLADYLATSLALVFVLVIILLFKVNSGRFYNPFV